MSSVKTKKVAIIGGGAAGFFAAIHVKLNFPDYEVEILEKTKKTLSKVKVSGGGRCNVTNAERSISVLSKAYPRGSKLLKKAFKNFNTQHTIDWFENRGIKLVTQEDNCIFPESQSSQTIIDCFLRECQDLDIAIRTQCRVDKIEANDGTIALTIHKEETPRVYDYVIVASGGSPKTSGLDWLKDLGHQIETPVPSLFTFNMPNENITSLMGVVVEPVLARIQSFKYESDGPLLITHWGMSGPAILKLSSYGARFLEACQYKFNVQISWVNEKQHAVVEKELNNIISQHGQKQLHNYKPYDLPKRLWLYFLDKADLPHEKLWNELGKKGVNKLVNLLIHDIYKVEGKTTFKEEFVTCGGVSLSSINTKTLESLHVPNLYFTGEVLDIDGITGGYNFQAAWTTAFIAAQLS